MSSKIRSSARKELNLNFIIPSIINFSRNIFHPLVQTFSSSWSRPRMDGWMDGWDTSQGRWCIASSTSIIPFIHRRAGEVHSTRWIRSSGEATRTKQIRSRGIERMDWSTTRNRRLNHGGALPFFHFPSVGTNREMGESCRFFFFDE